MTLSDISYMYGHDFLGKTHHVYRLWIYCICDDTSVLRDKLDHLVEGGPLDFLPFEVAERVLHKVEQHAALSQLLSEQLFPLRWRCICKYHKRNIEG